jgi:hypothetical protein
MLKLKIKSDLTQKKICDLMIPGYATFLQLHTALELILQLHSKANYSFMLMQERHSIEKNTAANFKIASVFAKNSCIRYLNPYPGHVAGILELEQMDDSVKQPFPIVSGAANEKELNQWLKQFCTFDEKWKYQNEKFFHDTEKDFCHLRTMKEKFEFLQFYGHMEGELRITIGNSRESHASLLERAAKPDLQFISKNIGLSVPLNRKKKEIAEAISVRLKEQTWLCLLLFPRRVLEFYLRVCKCKEGQKLSLNMQELDAIALLLYYGFLELLPSSQADVFKIELQKGLFLEEKEFGKKEEVTIYLSPEIKTGSWQKISAGYEKLSIRIRHLLQWYGVIALGDLCRILRECYDYRLQLPDLVKFIRFRVTMLGEAELYEQKEMEKYELCLKGIDVAYALTMQEQNGIQAEKKPVDRKELEQLDEKLAELLQGLTALMHDYTENISLLQMLTERIYRGVLGNESWVDHLEKVEEFLEAAGATGQMGFWYQMSNVYLKLPVSGLGGYSRIEYGKLHQLDNPYMILNGSKDETIFPLSFAAQWELFQFCDNMIDNNSDLAEKQLERSAKKYLDERMADGLMVYAYLLSGNPKLLFRLEKMADLGDEEAEQMLQDMYDLFEE